MNTTRRAFLTAGPLVAGAAAAGLTPSLQAKEAALSVLTAAEAIERAPGLPLLAAEQTPMHAILRVRAGLPDYAFNAWLEHGLWLAEKCKRTGATPI